MKLKTATLMAAIGAMAQLLSLVIGAANAQLANSGVMEYSIPLM